MGVVVKVLNESTPLKDLELIITLAMPTINEYANEPGYFIRARPSDAGNITYQVNSIAEGIFRKLEYEDGDDVDWRTIQALKLADLIYTGDQGVSDTQKIDFVTEAENSIESLTEQEARSLLDELEEQATLQKSKMDEVRDVLGVTTESMFERVEANITQALLQAGKKGRLDSLAISDYEFTVDISDLREEAENGYCNISLTGTLDGTFDEEPYQHGIFVCQIHGLEGWRCTSDLEKSWDFKAEMYRQMGVILPIILEELKAEDIDIGTPEETPPPEIGRWGFE